MTLPGPGLFALRRRVLLLWAALLPLTACALPVNHDLGNWARTASVAIDDPAIVVPSDGLRAVQIALARYFFALGILADHGVLVMPDDGAALTARMAKVGPAAQSAAQGIEVSLLAAMRATYHEPPSPHAPDVPPAPPDNRLQDTVQTADRHVQALLAVLTRSTDDAATGAACRPDPASASAARQLYRQTLESIGKGHAFLTASGVHVSEVQTGQIMDNENLELRRLQARRPAIGSAAPDSCRTAAMPPAAP